MGNHSETVENEYSDKIKGIIFVDHQRQIFQQVIQKHSQTPNHRGKTNPVHCCHKLTNPDCGDTIELTIQLNHNQDLLEDIKFEGQGCAICLASADLMAGYLRGKSITEALEMVENFRGMMQGKTEFPSDFKKLNILKSISNFPIRIKCATLSWHTLKTALQSIDRVS